MSQDFKVTTFDSSYSQRLASGDTILGGSSGSNSGYLGGDVTGSPGDLSVIGLRQVVSLASNMGDNTVGTVLTTISSSPWVAQFAMPSNSAVSSSSNSVTRTLGGQETIVTVASSGASRALNLGGGNVFDVTLTAAPVTITFTGIPSGVSSAWTLLARQDGVGSRTVTWPGAVVWPGGLTPTLSTTPAAVDVFSMFTLDAGTTIYGFPTSGSVAIGSNSTRVREISTAGASITKFSPFDHAHDGIGTITSSSSNTLQRGTVNFRPGANIAFGATDTDGDGEFDTLTISSTGGGTGGSASVATVDATLGADVSMTNANQAYDGPSGSFAAGTWLVVWKAIFHGSVTNATHDFTVKLWDGSTVYDESSNSEPTANTSTLGVLVSGTAIVTLAGSATLKLTAFDVRAGSTMSRDVVNNGATSHTATRITGYKVS